MFITTTRTTTRTTRYVPLGELAGPVRGERGGRLISLIESGVCNFSEMMLSCALCLCACIPRMRRRKGGRDATVVFLMTILAISSGFISTPSPWIITFTFRSRAIARAYTDHDKTLWYCTVIRSHGPLSFANAMLLSRYHRLNAITRTIAARAPDAQGI